MENKEWDEMLEVMIRNSPLVAEVARGSRSEYVNQRRVSFYDCSRGELPGCIIEGKLHPEDKEKTREAMTKMLKGQRSSPCEFRLIQPDGSLRYFRLLTKKVQERKRNWYEFIECRGLYSRGKGGAA